MKHDRFQIKHPKKDDKNNNFDENYKKMLSAMALGMKASKQHNENDKNNNFEENYKKLLSAM